MELEAVKQLIDKYMGRHAAFVANAVTAKRYYEGKNDITLNGKKPQDCDNDCPNPLRHADNRIAFNFHGLLVDQKASYLFTSPPLFDTKDDEMNQIIAGVLGDGYAKKAKQLCVEASNTGVGWVHYWSDPVDGFKWGVIPSEQIFPIFTNFIDKKLEAVLRMYADVDDDGQEWHIYEIWNTVECQVFRRRGEIFEVANRFSMNVGGADEPTNVYRHNMGVVPFIDFPNNDRSCGDLDKIKGLIDAYDKTYSGFMNDLEDVQEVIFILTNYGGENLREFMSDLKYYKAIKTENNGDGDKSGISTLTIEIPVEARDKMLELTRKAIFDMGQGVDPQQQGIDHTSGVAMKFLYSLLELKAGLMETEFKLSFGTLVRAICRHYGHEVGQITQTWTRTAIRNDSELVDMCAKSAGVISKKTILVNHPFVENAEDEQAQIDEEKGDDPYSAPNFHKIGFNPNTDGGNDDDKE